VYLVLGKVSDGRFVRDTKINVWQLSTHTARNCPAYPALPPASQPPLASPATPEPWIVPGGPGLVQNTQSATQNWVFGPSSGPPGVVIGAGYPALSQSTYIGPYYPH
jgi:hypothetical protein